MALVEIQLAPCSSAPPGPARELVDLATRRIDDYLARVPCSPHGFVASDYAAVYLALQQIAANHLTTGSAFCEWGSGFGVVALLAAQLGFDACGIEIDAALVDASRRLAADLAIPAQFVHGSFIPPGGETLAESYYVRTSADSFWLAISADDAYQQLDRQVDDFDLIFAYPWPGEAECLERLFHRYAADGALLLSYAHLESVRLLRKVAKPRRN